MSTHIKFSAAHFILFSIWFTVLVTDASKAVNHLLGDVACTISSFAITLPFTAFVMSDVFDKRGMVVSDLRVYATLLIVALINSLCVGKVLSLIWKVASGHYRHWKDAKVIQRM